MSEAPLTIAVSTPIFLPLIGGAELGIHEIYHRLGERHRVIIVTPRVRDVHVRSYGANDYRSENYEVRHFTPVLDATRPPIVGRALKRTFIPYLSELHRLAATERVDVINYHYFSPHGVALVALRRAWGVPAVVSLVGRSDVARELSWFLRLQARVVLAACDVALPNSAFYLREFYDGPKVRVIPYGVDTSAFSPDRWSASLRRKLGAHEGRKLLLCVQRLVSLKRVDVLIRVVAELRKRGDDAVLVIVGQGTERESLERLAGQLGVDDAVRFTGYVPSQDLPTYFASADAFVFHSLSETYGVALVQAKASGLPIIAARSSCIADVVDPESGSVVEPFDVRGFADAIAGWTDTGKLGARSKRGSRARAARHLDWDRIAEEYEGALLEAAQSSRARSFHGRPR